MSIVIHVPNVRCRAGTTIAGTVSLQGHSDIDLRSITISLIGRCKTKATRSSGQNSVTYRGRAATVEETQTLFKGPHTLHPGHEWSFAFTVPAHCTARSQDAFKDGGPFNLDKSQDLPPCFESEHDAFGWKEECFISYELEAYCARRGTFAKDLSSARRLDFYTTRDIERPEPRLTTLARPLACSSPALEPGREDIPLSFKDKLKGLYTTKLPVARFSLKVLLPKVAILGQALPLFLAVQHDIEASSAPSPPLIHLRKVSIGLRSRTYIQCIRNGIFHEGDQRRAWSETVVLASCDFSLHMDQAPLVNERLDIRHILDTTIPKSYTPTFSTFNIRRDYALLIKATVVCAHKTLKTEWTNDSFTLLAAEYAAKETQAASARDVGPLPVTSVSQDEVAPAYEAEPGAVSPPRYQDVKGL
ncbi:MAG: hypothetical protein Q9163_005618 [Psora crenata]